MADFFAQVAEQVVAHVVAQLAARGVAARLGWAVEGTELMTWRTEVAGWGGQGIVKPDYWVARELRVRLDELVAELTAHGAPLVFCEMPCAPAPFHREALYVSEGTPAFGFRLTHSYLAGAVDLQEEGLVAVDVRYFLSGDG